MAHDRFFGFDTTQRQTLEKLFADLVATAAASVPVATTAEEGVVKKAAAQSNFAGADAAAIVAELNTFLGKLKAAGLVA